MSAFSGFPGGVPGAVPGVAPTAGAAFVLIIPPDPTWEPMEQDDLLDKDGFFAAMIKSERFREPDGNKNGGVWFGMEIMDADFAGKRVSKLMPDPRSTKGDSWGIWRSLIRSLYGSTDAGKAGVAQGYTPGMWTGHYVYFRTGRYVGNNGEPRTSVENMVTQAEWEEARKAGGERYRWAPKAARGAGTAGAGPAGALPGGLPASFPGAGALPGTPAAATGFPGTAGMPTAPSAPRPATAAPMAAPVQLTQTAPSFAAPPAAAPAQAAPPAFAFPQAPAAAPPAAAPAAAPPQFTMPTAPPAAPAAAPALGAPPQFAFPANGAPAPVAQAGAFAFPGTPGGPTGPT